MEGLLEPIPGQDQNKKPPDPIRYNTAKARARKRLLLLGLMSDYSKYVILPNIYLSGERMLNINVRKSRGKDGKLNICKLSDFELHQVKSILGSLPSSLLNKGDTRLIILETGFSRSATGFICEFLEGGIVWLFHTRLMYRIGASLETNHEVTLYYIVINDERNFSVLGGTDLFMNYLKYKLLIPQDTFMEIQILKNSGGSFTVTWYKYVIKISYEVPITRT